MHITFNFFESSPSEKKKKKKWIEIDLSTLHQSFQSTSLFRVDTIWSHGTMCTSIRNSLLEMHCLQFRNPSLKGNFTFNRHWRLHNTKNLTWNYLQRLWISLIEPNLDDNLTHKITRNVFLVLHLCKNNKNTKHLSKNTHTHTHLQRERKLLYTSMLHSPNIKNYEKKP